MPEKPTARWAAQSTMPAAMAPDCEISARFPAAGICAEKLALRLTQGIMMPRQFGPISRMPYFCAARSAASASEPGPWPSPALTMTAPAAPRRPRARSPRPRPPRRAGAARLIDQVRNRAGRRGEDNEFRRESQFCDAADGRDTVDLVIARIDEAEFALELGFANIVENGTTDRAMARTGPDQRDGMRRKQIFQTISRHRSYVSGESRCPVNRYSAQCVPGAAC